MNSRIHSFLVVGYETLMSAVLSLPRFRTCNQIKSAYLRVLGARVGARVVMYPGIWIMPASRLELGDDVDLARGVMITGQGGVRIGHRTLIGYGARIISSNHHVPSDRPIFGAGHDHAAVVIGDDVWIGAGATILPGTTIGNHAIVAAGAVVTKDIPQGGVAAGVPARLIRSRPLLADAD